MFLFKSAKSTTYDFPSAKLQPEVIKNLKCLGGNSQRLCLRLCVVLSLCETPFCCLAAGSVGRNLANKPNVYISSSAGARWKEVSTKCDNDIRNNTAESQATCLAIKNNTL